MIVVAVILSLCYIFRRVQGGQAKVRPTYVLAGNIILVTFECIGKIQKFSAYVITV